MHKKLINACSLIFSFLVFSMAGFQAFAWDPPLSAPTAGNVSAPLNVSNIAQTKSGGLLLNTGGAANGLIIQFGNMGLGTTSPSAKFAITALGSGTGRAFALANSSNVEKVTILDNGNVGILKSAPAYPLDVAGDLNATRVCIAGNCQSSWPGAGAAQWTASGANLNYTSGNVGIGTTTVNSKLTVDGAIQVGNDPTACSTAKAATMRWDGAILQFCDGTAWRNLQVAADCQATGPCQLSPHGSTCESNNVDSVPYGSTCPSNQTSSCSNGIWSPAPLAYGGCYVLGPTSGCKNDTTACNYDPTVDVDDSSSCRYDWNDAGDGCVE